MLDHTKESICKVPFLFPQGCFSSKKKPQWHKHLGLFQYIDPKKKQILVDSVDLFGNTVGFLRVKIERITRKLGENDRHSAKQVGGQSFSKTRFGDDEFIWSFGWVQGNICLPNGVPLPPTGKKTFVKWSGARNIWSKETSWSRFWLRFPTNIVSFQGVLSAFKVLIMIQKEPPNSKWWLTSRDNFARTCVCFSGDFQWFSRIRSHGIHHHGKKHHFLGIWLSFFPTTQRANPRFWNWIYTPVN